MGASKGLGVAEWKAIVVKSAIGSGCVRSSTATGSCRGGIRAPWLGW